jgi:hypothetical protein
VAGAQNVIVDVTLRHEFNGSHANLIHNEEPYVNGALDATVKEKFDNYQHDYNGRHFFFLPEVMTTSGRISGDFLRLLYTLSHRQAANYFTRMGILDPSPRHSNNVEARTSSTIVLSSASRVPRQRP